jgi:hypothetical protein
VTRAGIGSAGSSAGLAAALGVGYSFAGFINPGGAVPARTNPPGS